MPIINPSLPTTGQPNSSEEPKIVTDLSQILGLINGGLDNVNIATAAAIAYSKLALNGNLVAGDASAGLADNLGVTANGTTRRAFTFVAGPFGNALTTAVAIGSAVTVTVPNNGIALCMAQAQLSVSNGGATGSLLLLVDGALTATLGTTSSTSGVTIRGVVPVVTGTGAHTFQLAHTVTAATDTVANASLGVVAFGF